MSSSHSDSYHPPPYSDADDPLISNPEKLPRPPSDDVHDSLISNLEKIPRPPSDDVDDLISNPEKSPRPPLSFDSREQFQWHLINLSGRCLMTALSLSFLILGLLFFSRLGVLSKLEQYGFNAITILLGAFASLGLGSMLEYLGSMLRWRLLAMKKYKMQDIELLLDMTSPTGAASLLFTHFQEWRLSQTTFIVMLYLFVNITGRFSVAIFGLTYNVLNDPATKLPILTTNWNSPDCSVLAARNSVDFEEAKEGLRSYLDLAEGGLAILTQRPKIEFNISVPQNLNDDTYETLAVKGSNIYKVGSGVELAYNITDRDGTDLIPSGRTVRTWARCTIFRLNDRGYWRNYDGGNQTWTDWRKESNTECIADVLRVLNREKAWPQAGVEQVTWAAPLPAAGRPTTPSVTYVVYNETAWECNSTLSEWEKEAPSPKGLFDSASLFLFPIASGLKMANELSSTVIVTRTKAVIGYMRTYTRTIVSRSTARARVRGENKDFPRATPAIGIRAQPARVQTTTIFQTATSTLFSTGIRTRTVTLEPIRKGSTASVAYRLFSEPQSRASPSVGVQTLNFYKNGIPLPIEQKEHFNRYVATLVARLPIAAIAFGNQVCPRMQKDPKARSEEDIKTTLDVNWSRVAIVAGCIVAGQILAIAVVLYYCRNIYVREDGHLATAELLKTVLCKIEDGSMMTGEELEDALDKVLGGPVSYGTIQGLEGDDPRVAIGRDVNYFFPKFPQAPQFRKRSAFRR